MKKILCIALFSFAVMANANNKKEVVVNNSTETEITVNKSGVKEIFEDDVDCGAQGDLLYSKLREQGVSHRDARGERRDNVRDCRGGTWAWIEVCLGFIGNCDN